MVLLRDKTIRPKVVVEGHVPALLDAILPALQQDALEQQLVTTDDQLFLLEGIGWLLAEKHLPDDMRGSYLQAFAEPLTAFLLHLKNVDLPATLLATEQEHIVQKMCHILALLTCVIAAFSSLKLILLS